MVYNNQYSFLLTVQVELAQYFALLIRFNSFKRFRSVAIPRRGGISCAQVSVPCWSVAFGSLL